MTTAAACPCGSQHAGEVGAFYVSVADAGRVGLIAGPFATHAEALAMVEPARTEAEKANAWAAFYAFGTVRMAEGYTAPGVLNGRLGLQKKT